MWVELRRVHALGRAQSPYPHRTLDCEYPHHRRAHSHAHARTLRERGAERNGGLVSVFASWSIAFRIWSACVVLGSSLRSLTFCVLP